MIHIVEERRLVQRKTERNGSKSDSEDEGLNLKASGEKEAKLRRKKVTWRFRARVAL